MDFLDTDYARDLQNVSDDESLDRLIEKWAYWIDTETKTLSGKWAEIKPLLDDCRDNSVTPADKHNKAIALLMPAKLIRVSMFARKFRVPWGCAYIKMKEHKMIDF